jgi:probable phosphoglycerate mutase
VTPGAAASPPAEDLSLVTNVVLVRHGLPLTGVSKDPPLSPEGLHQARRAGDWLRWESPAALVSSSYLRAQDTARGIGDATGLALDIDDDLREWAGDQKGPYITPELLGASERGRAFAEGRFADFVPPHDPLELAQRMSDAVARAAKLNPGRTVVLVSHGGAINALFAHVLGLTQTFFFNPGYTSLSRLQVMPSGRMVVVAVNETSHLVAVRSAASLLAVDEGAA